MNCRSSIITVALLAAALAGDGVIAAASAQEKGPGDYGTRCRTAGYSPSRSVRCGATVGYGYRPRPTVTPTQIKPSGFIKLR